MLSVMPWEKCKDCTWMTTKMRQARIHLWPSLTWTHSALISRWCRSAQRVHQLTPEDSVVEHGWIVEADWLPAYEANGCECFEVWITEANCLFHMFMSNFIWIFLMCITFTHTHTPFIRLKHFIVSKCRHASILQDWSQQFPNEKRKKWTQHMSRQEGTSRWSAMISACIVASSLDHRTQYISMDGTGPPAVKWKLETTNRSGTGM